MKTFPVSLTMSAALAAAALALAPIAPADMLVGNYRMDTNRDPGHSWLWSVRGCTPNQPECVHVRAIPQPNGQAAPYAGDAHLVNGQYTMNIDIPDGVRCVVSFLPSHDVYTWDPVSLAGNVVSTYNAGCGNSPGGTETYPFSLVRW